MNSVHVIFDVYGLDLQVGVDQGNACEIFSASDERFRIWSRQILTLLYDLDHEAGYLKPTRVCTGL